jgi:hypothetical protein
MSGLAQLETRGWCRFPDDPVLTRWVDAALPVATKLAADPNNIRDWLRCGGTWFAGVNSLPNDADGRVGAGPALSGQAVDAAVGLCGPQSWDRAQISVIYPGYPRAMEGETAAAFRFRRDRDAAHVDGLLPIGPERRRHMQEPHAFVLGIPLVATSRGASPMVVWEGSHARVRAAFRAALLGVAAQDWGRVDLTDTYHRVRRDCFEHCPRVEVHARPGEAYLIHRLCLHGVAPWQKGAEAPPQGRMIAYFRPELSDPADWLT